MNAIAKFYYKFISHDLDPNKEVLITAGAYEALYSSLQGHTNPGDEWIIIEPFFDCYVPMVQSAGGIPKYIALKPVRSLDNKRKIFLYYIKYIMLCTCRNVHQAQLPLAIGYLIGKKWNVFSIRKLKVSSSTIHTILQEKYLRWMNCNLLPISQKNGIYLLFLTRFMSIWFTNRRSI